MFSSCGEKYSDVLIFHTNLLSSLQCNFDKEMCDEIFNDLSDHLFDKWLKSNGNILNFFGQLDNQNKKRILKWSLTNIIA